MIAAVATVLNEADIIGDTIENLLAYGVDRIHIAHGPSTDGTLEILESFPEVRIVPDAMPIHMQPQWTWKLAQRAEYEGAEWVIPFDADEFIYPDPRWDSIPAALAVLPPYVNKLRIDRWLHLDRDRRYVEPERLPKVAWRTGIPVQCMPGNHDVLFDGTMAHEILWMREIQFRSLAHMARKCRERVDRIDPALPVTDGAHQRVLAAMTEEELELEWARLQAVPVVYDPIPVRTRDGVA